MDEPHGLGLGPLPPAVPERQGQLTCGLVPACGPPVQLSLVLRLGGVEVVAQQLGEQVVVAERHPGGVEAGDEQVRRLDVGEGHPGPEQHGGQLGGELVDHAGVEQEAAHLGRLRAEQLGRQVLGDHLGGPGEAA